MGETGALARARGASELRGLCRAVKQRALVWQRGGGEARSPVRRGGGRLAEGREGRGRGHRPEDARTEERI